ncbi:hypothetical protein G6F37_011777 [Rhizopus arrhizus]|nr:hypothetical protein G6F38_008197 [Rhizopus arrhizus]KAG1147478.1 hypothetical protein G6F37_011777 [Rhizopus arrhizus]
MKLFKKKSKSSLCEPFFDLPAVNRKPPIQPDRMEPRLAMPKPRRFMKEIWDRPEEKTEVDRLPFSSSVHDPRLHRGQTARSFEKKSPTPAIDSDDSESVRTYHSARASLADLDSTEQAYPRSSPALSEPSPKQNSPAVNTDDRRQLQARIVWMERQRAKEMAERQRMERALLDSKREVMEALIDTQRQLTLLLKHTVKEKRSSSVSHPEASLAGRRPLAASQGLRAKRPERTSHRLSYLDVYDSHRACVHRYPVMRSNKRYDYE